MCMSSSMLSTASVSKSTNATPCQKNRVMQCRCVVRERSNLIADPFEACV